ncbi:MAG: glycosyl hydrolase 115 family protein [Bacteroidales bacterium]|nr:glycosyl hydrolase 115 family protein [Bacteroidales bacterium]
MKKKLLVIILTVFSFQLVKAQYINFDKSSGGVDLTKCSLIYSDEDFEGVKIAVKNLQNDFFEVTGKKPDLNNQNAETQIIIGTIGKTKMLDAVLENTKTDISEIQGKWEAGMIKKLDEKTILILGSDKRGTIFAVYDLSRNIGVSPWKYWADVPAQKHDFLGFNADKDIVFQEPKVKYRGIFLNDEEPCLGRWAVKNFGGFKHEFYEKVFELLLRLKCNFMWPAMWWAAFNEDDPLNAYMADSYGIVMGNSHHEPMNRSYAEWHKKKRGAWNFQTNNMELEFFWREGIRTMGNKETIVTIGMRGDGDEAMEEGTNIALLENIVKTQRSIIEDITKKPADQTPQVWALYKEVQDYYDKGMKVPDDVTLLLCDDNWGNVRRLPELNSPKRKGGYGMYWHFDYVGGPRSYKWINTNQLQKFYDQFDLAIEYGADRLWIVNVGDLKPMELPISFFADYAYDPSKFTPENVIDYNTKFAEECFGKQFSKQIGEILQELARINAAKKPELLDAHALPALELFLKTEELKKLRTEAQNIMKNIPKELQDAYYQLVMFPTEATANLYEMYSEYLNAELAQKPEVRKKHLETADRLFGEDSLITKKYHSIAGGKWDLMMAQTHIGYKIWNQPETNIKPTLPEKSIPQQDVDLSIVDIEADKYKTAQGQWHKIIGGGRFGSAVSYYPSTERNDNYFTDKYLEYEFELPKNAQGSELEITCYTSPTLDFLSKDHYIALSVDGGEVKRLNIHENKKIAWGIDRVAWEQSVINNCYKTKTTVPLKSQKKHTLRVYLTDGAVVYENFEIKVK